MKKEDMFGVLSVGAGLSFIIGSLLLIFNFITTMKALLIFGITNLIFFVGILLLITKNKG